MASVLVFSESVGCFIQNSDDFHSAGKGCLLYVLNEHTIHTRAGRAGAGGFTLIELLVDVAVISILLSLLLPALARAKQKAQRIACLGNLSQITRAFTTHLAENEDRFPDRRDLKTSLPGGYRPWASWPPSDPRAGWAAVLLAADGADAPVWDCPGRLPAPLRDAVQASQYVSLASNAPVARYWTWRFDRTNELSDPTMLEDFWGKTTSRAISDLQNAGDPVLGSIAGPSDVELVTDPYFPKTIPSVEPGLSGRTLHAGGRNHGYLDGHAGFTRDSRTPW